MNAGYSRALGVSCTHCHNEQDFASDEKRPKRAAREMAAMHRMINQQLAGMQNLEPDHHVINCSTCHRGHIDPAATDR
jgi:Photosynthetic reaction centre cytochrome C subunit